jgi:hypothetical protein
MSNPTIEENDPQLSAAMAELSNLEAADSQPPQQDAPATDAAPAADSVSKEADHAGPVEDGKAPASPPKSPTDTLATAVKSEKEPSRYEKAAARSQKSWEQLNAEKVAFKLEREKFEADRKAHEQASQEFEKAKAEASKPKYGPEQYESAAKNWEQEADRLDDDGKFNEAEERRVMARKAAEYAKELRANPPKGQAEIEKDQAAKFEAEKKEWWSKAAIDFPAVAKANSPENQRLNEFIAKEPGAMQSPKAMYFAARMVTAETAAARVPEMEKELGQLRARVEELNQKLSVPSGGIPGGQSGPMSFEQLNADEQFAQLEREARGMTA